MRRLRLNFIYVLSKAWRAKFPLLAGLLLLTGSLYADHSLSPVVKAKSNSITSLSQSASELFHVSITLVATPDNSSDPMPFENADDEFKSLKKYTEGSSCSLSVFIKGSNLLPKYFYSPASFRYINFRGFRI
ncbi:hypothetical protein BH09BAC3_BH09BAC3_06570 [soil metagenome]